MLHYFFQLLPALLSCSLALGIWWYHSFDLVSPCILIILLLLTGYHYENKKNLPFVLILLMISFIIGAIRYKQEITFYKNVYATLNNQVCDVTAAITDIQTSNHPYFKKQITIKITKIKIYNRWKPLAFSIQLNLPDLKENIAVADEIKISNIQFRYPANSSFKKYLMRKGIIVSLFQEPISITIIKKPYLSINRLLHQIRANLAHSLHSKMPRKVRSLFFSIFLGKRNNKSDSAMRHQCKLWGISHYLARSGLHLILFILIWQFFLNVLPFSTDAKTAAAMIISMLYCVLSWPSVSFSRALYTFLLHQMCKLASLPSNSMYLLGIVCFVTLLINPHHLFFVDFQLSFILAFAIAWYAFLRYSTWPASLT